MYKISNIGIVVALSEEFEVLISTLEIDSSELMKQTHEGISYITYEFRYKTINNLEINLILLLINDMTNTESSSATQWFLDHYNLSCLINIGISGLVDKDYHLGDVILGESSYEYDYRGKIVDNKDFFEIKHSGRGFNTTKKFYEYLSQLKNNNPKIYKEWESLSNKELEANISRDLLTQLKDKGLLSDNQIIDKGMIASGGNVGTSISFKGYLLDQNRLYATLDMESAGFLSAIDKRDPLPYSLVIKAISDPADDRKKHLDQIKNGAIRKIAMLNASNLLKIFLNIFDFYNFKFTKINEYDSNLVYRIFNRDQIIDNEDYLYKTTLENLGESFKKPNFLENDLKLWGNIFYSISSSKIINLREDNYIEDIFNFINNSDNGIAPLNIIGNPGTGISPCLSVLYRIYYYKFKSKETKYYPIYIDFRKYRVKIYKDDLDILKQAKDYVISEMNNVLSFLNKYKINDILLILDGIDYDSPFQTPMEDVIFKIFKNFPTKKIIGVRYYSQHVRRVFNHNGASITFSPINIDNDQFNRVVKQLCLLENKEADSDTIKGILKECNFNEIDFFLLRLIFNNLEDILENKDIHFVLEQFCLAHLDKTNKKEISIDDMAKFAFDYEINKIQFTEDYLYNNPSWYLFNRNKEIQYFLIAKHVINSLLLIAEGENNINFNFTYHNRINSYCRFLINREPKIQKKILEGAKKVLSENDKLYAHANALYLLGRLRDEYIKNNAKKIIKDYLIKNKKMKIEAKMSLDKDNASLLALRTCYISLACLGDNTSSETYLEKLLSYPAWCNMNRGFHLIYYGDIEYDPNVGLIAIDNLGNFSKTYTYLYNRISNFIKKPLTDIEIYTFFSLIQQRHEGGKLKDDTIRLEVINLIEQILEKDIVEYIA